jgi:hypothetical protein
MSLISLGNVYLREDLSHAYKHRLSLSAKLKRKKIEISPEVRQDSAQNHRPKRSAILSRRPNSNC